MRRRTRARAAFAAGIAAAVASAAAARQPAPTPVPAPPPSLPIEQAVLLGGKPFPPVHPTELRLPDPKRTFFLAGGKDPGDGTEARPWNDFQAALAHLTPGDRLRVRAGSYARTVSIEEGCVDGSERQPIQVVFDGKAEIEPPDGSPALVIARANWVIVGPYAKLGGSKAPGILLRGRGAHDVRLLGARVSDGMGPGIRVEAESARVTIRNAYVSKTNLPKMGPGSCGIDIAAGTREIEVTESHLSNNPAGSIRVRAVQGSERPARDLQIRGNSIRDDGATAILVEAADGVTIADNTLSDATGVDGTRGVALERVERASVRSNRIAGFGLGVAVGHADPDGGRVLAARDVTIERNGLEGGAGGTAFVVEAGTDVRIVNNLTEGYASGVLVFGAPPSTRGLTVVNNLFLGVSDVALLLRDPAAAVIFDYNVFSPSGPVTAEVGRGGAVALSRFLKGGTMPHTQLKHGVHVVNRDLGRVTGIATVDRGKAVEGLQFRGSAPDLGVGER